MSSRKKKPKQPPAGLSLSSLPEDIQYLDLFGVVYYVPWDRLVPGASFFLKTTASASIVQKKLRKLEKVLNMELRAHPRCEFGYYGVRVWRVS